MKLAGNIAGICKRIYKGLQPLAAGPCFSRVIGPIFYTELTQDTSISYIMKSLYIAVHFGDAEDVKI
jgi:hypothetical protein